MAEPKEPDTRRLQAFAARLAELAPDAWHRINSRCALLDPFSIETFVGRLALYSRSVPDADPYRLPGLRPFLATMSSALGLLTEVAARLGPSDPEAFDRAAQRHPKKTAADFMRLETVAQRQQRDHPGTASALRAVAHGLLWQQKASETGFAAIYQPFEPEIPLASLEPVEPAA